MHHLLGLKMTLNQFMEDHRLLTASKAIADLEPCPYAGRLTAEQVLIALCETADVWPLSIAASVIRDAD